MLHLVRHGRPAADPPNLPRPDEPSVPTWEPPTPTRDRVVAAVRRLGSTHDGDLVLVGHGTAWTLLVAELTGRPPDLDAWERLAMRPVSRSEGGRQPQGASRRAAAGKATTASADSGWETGAEMSDQPKSLPLVFDEPRGRGKPPRHLADLSADDRLALVTDLGLPGYRAKQLSTHYFVRLVADAAEMTDLPATDREQVVAALLPTLMTPLRTLEADKGTTRKTLWKLFDGALVESVLMRYPDRVTLCVSSQAGCGMACPFCATGQGGLQRNMSAAEIVEQVVAGARSLVRGEVPGGPGRVSNVVFMGMGEPMANYKAVIGAIRRLTDKAPDGLGMSARGITLSTVGLVPRINQLADEGIPVTLALSLHAPDDELRNELVPINTRWSVHEAVEAAWNYARVTKRRVSIEYAMMCDINDQAWRADLLGDLLTSYGDWGWVHVNLIPLNPTPGSKWTASRPEVEREFVRRLEAKGVPTTVRDTRGSEIDGACGQLAAVDS